MKTLAVVTGLIAAAVTVLGPVPMAEALPAGVRFDHTEPLVGNVLQVGTVAANNPLDPPTWQLKADVYFDNTGTRDRTASRIRVSYPGSSLTEHDYVPTETFVLSAGEPRAVTVNDGLLRDLPFPLPPEVRIRVYVGSDPTPLDRTYGLAVRQNDVPTGSYLFPARQSDLDPGQHWYFATRHHHSASNDNSTIEAGSSRERYGYDIQVAEWDGDGWATRLAGSSADDFLAWNQPVYAMADGTVIACNRDSVDVLDGGTPSFRNVLRIRTGNELIYMSHFKQNSIPRAICPDDSSADEEVTGFTRAVRAGQFLGRVGMTGRTGGKPHIHVHVTSATTTSSGADDRSGVPLQFMNVRAVADDDNVDDLGANPTLRRLDNAILHRNSLVDPNPCAWPPPDRGADELSWHGIASDCYLDHYNLALSRGYQPYFVDGYVVGGQTFYNAVFRTSSLPFVHVAGVTESDYDKLVGDMDQPGWRLHQVDAYGSGGTQRFTATFQQRTGPSWEEFNDLSEAQFNTLTADRFTNGYKLVNLSIVDIGASNRYTGLLEQLASPDWGFETVPAADFSATVDVHDNGGRKITYVNGNVLDGVPYLTGIFYEPVGGRTTSDEQLTDVGYQSLYTTETGGGRFTRAVTGYDNGSGRVRFAGVWRGRPNTTITQGPTGPTTSRAATFRFSGDNPFSTRFECALDAALAFTSCSSPQSYTNLPPGEHVFRVRAIEREGFTDPTAASRTWTILGGG